MSRKNTKAKRAKRERRRQSSSAGRKQVGQFSVDQPPPRLDRDRLVAQGAPPEVIEMLMEAEQAAIGGDTAPMERALEMLRELAVMSPEPAGNSATECYPLSSPEAAETLFAFSSVHSMDPGYAVAAEKAIECDPCSVEALATLGDFAKSADERLSWYRRACEAAESKPGDVVASEMPSVRFAMGGRLVNEAHYADAIEIMLPGLDEDPSDPEGMRFAVIDLMLRLRWGDELQSLLNRYADDEVGPVAFARAIACFQADGPTRHANALLRAAHDAKPHVAPFLAAIEPMPSQPVDHFSIGSREEAIMIAGYLLPGVRVKEGAARWIRDTLELDFVSSTSQGESDRVDDEPLASGGGDLDIALSLADGTETWRYHLHRVDDGSYLAVLLADAELVGFDQFSKRPGTRQLRHFLLDSVCTPITGRPRKPRLLQVPTKADVTALQKTVGTYGVTCRQHRVSSAEKVILNEMLETISRHLDADSRGETLSSDACDLSDLPQTNEQWLMGVFQPPMWVGDRSTPYRPFIQLILDATNGTILLSETSLDRPSSKRQIEMIAGTMQRPMFGPPRRPEVLIVDPDTSADELAREETSLEIVSGDDGLRSCFDDVITDLLRGVGPVDEAVSKQAGISDDMMARFYRSAARFYKAAPWTMVGGDKLMKLARLGGSGQTWGVSVIGQMGQTIGLSLMEDVDAARAFIDQDASIDDLNAILLEFGEAFDMPPMDLWYLERNDWPVAGEEAYPLFMKVIQGVGAASPSCDELQMIEPLMNIIPRFLDQPRDKSFMIKDARGHEFELSWEIG